MEFGVEVPPRNNRETAEKIAERRQKHRRHTKEAAHERHRLSFRQRPDPRREGVPHLRRRRLAPAGCGNQRHSRLHDHRRSARTAQIPGIQHRRNRPERLRARHLLPSGGRPVQLLEPGTHPQGRRGHGGGMHPGEGRRHPRSRRQHQAQSARRPLLRILVRRPVSGRP